MAEETGKLHIYPKKSHDDILSAEPGDIITLSSEQIHMRDQMVKSVTEVPQFHVSMEINASTILANINQWAEEKRPSFTAFLVQGVGKALQAFPSLNATFVSNDRIKIHPQIHIAVAIDTPAGVTLPVLLDVSRQTILGLDKELRRLRKKALHEELSPHDTEGATFTIANLGIFGVSEFTTIIHPPQVAALAIGAISYRLVMTGNRIINLPFFTVTLTADYRVINTAMAAKFLRKFKEILEE